MLAVGALCAAQLAAAGTAQQQLFRVLPPTPPPMTAWQKDYMAFVQADAAQASATARPDLLAALDDPDFRAVLTGCCPLLSKMPSEALLDWYHAQIDVSEMVHNFNAEPPPQGGHHHGGDPVLAVCRRTRPATCSLFAAFQSVNLE